MAPPEGASWTSPRDLIYDRENFLARFAVRPPLVEPSPPARLVHQPSKIHLRVRSDTHATERLTIPAGEPLDVAVDLLPTASLRVIVLQDEGTSIQLTLEMEDESRGWRHAWQGAAVPIAGEPAGDLYEGLRPGRYRLRDKGMDWESDEFEVVAGPRPAEFVWDLRSGAFAEGEIILPPGVDPLRVHGECLPDPEQERVVLTKARSGIRLKMVKIE